MVASALGAVPWEKIIKLAPPILEQARRFYETLINKKRNQPPSRPKKPTLDSVSAALDDIQLRMETVEENEAKVAELISQMAAQEEALSRGLQIVSARVTILSLYQTPRMTP